MVYFVATTSKKNHDVISTIIQLESNPATKQNYKKMYIHSIEWRIKRIARRVTRTQTETASRIIIPKSFERNGDSSELMGRIPFGRISLVDCYCATRHKQNNCLIRKITQAKPTENSLRENINPQPLKSSNHAIR